MNVCPYPALKGAMRKASCFKSMQSTLCPQSKMFTHTRGKDHEYFAIAAVVIVRFCNPQTDSCGLCLISYFLKEGIIEPRVFAVHFNRLPLLKVSNVLAASRRVIFDRLVARTYNGQPAEMWGFSCWVKITKSTPHVLVLGASWATTALPRPHIRALIVFSSPYDRIFCLGPGAASMAPPTVSLSIYVVLIGLVALPGMFACLHHTALVSSNMLYIQLYSAKLEFCLPYESASASWYISWHMCTFASHLFNTRRASWHGPW